MNMQAMRHHQPFGLVTFALVGALTFAWGAAEALAQQSKEGIGFVIASNGAVTITSKTAGPRPASLRQNVFPHDVIKTGPNSTAKILFDDNTILNVTEDSQIEITEYVYDPASKQRRTVFNMLQGRVKALVAGFYASTNSRFEIRTPTAVAAARGTEYVVWTFVQNGQVFTGIAVTTGSVTVTNAAGVSVTVSAGQYTTTSASTPPSTPAPTSSAPANVQAQMKGAEVKTDSTVITLVNTTMASNEAFDKAREGTPPTVIPSTITVTVLPIIKCTFATPGATGTPEGCTP